MTGCARTVHAVPVDAQHQFDSDFLNAGDHCLYSVTAVKEYNTVGTQFNYSSSIALRLTVWSTDRSKARDEVSQRDSISMITL